MQQTNQGIRQVVDPDLETLVQQVLADCRRAEDTANTVERAAARAQDVVKKADDKAADIDARRKQLITEPDADREAKDAEAQATKAETTSKAVSSKDKNAKTVEKAGASLSSASSALAAVARKLSDAATPVKKTQKAADGSKRKSLSEACGNVIAAVGKAQGEANASEAAGSSL